MTLMDSQPPQLLAANKTHLFPFLVNLLPAIVLRLFTQEILFSIVKTPSRQGLTIAFFWKPETVGL